MVMSDIEAHRRIAPAMGQAARLYPVDDPVGLARALETLLGDAAVLATARAEAWKLGQVRFNWDIEKRHFLNCVNSALENGNISSGLGPVSRKVPRTIRRC